jgi:hypothetical protein
VPHETIIVVWYHPLVPSQTSEDQNMLQVYATSGVPSDSVVRITNLRDSLHWVRGDFGDSLISVRGNLSTLIDATRATNRTVAQLSERLDSLQAASNASIGSPMAGVGLFLQQLFTKWFYPSLIVLVFIGLVLWTIAVIANAGQDDARSRRLIGAALPIAILILLVSLSQRTSEHEYWARFVSSWTLQIITGMITGFALMYLGRTVARSDHEVWASISAFIISGMASFILYAVMMGAVASIGVYLLAALIILGGDVILRGTYTRRVPRRLGTQPSDRTTAT